VIHASNGTWDEALCTAGTFIDTTVLVDGQGVSYDGAGTAPENSAGEGVLYLSAGTHEIAVTASLRCGAMGNDWEAEGPITITSRVSVIPR
jgi:hypothetical protein